MTDSTDAEAATETVSQPCAAEAVPQDVTEDGRATLATSLAEAEERIRQLTAERDRFRSSFDACLAAIEAERQERRAAEAELERLRNPSLPSILINTMPKSGSVYIHKHLGQALGMPFSNLGNGYTLADQVQYWSAKSFIGTSSIAQNHFEPSDINVQILDRLVGRWILHIRDPRQALLSWVHHLDLLKAENREDALLWVTPTPPPGYFDLDLTDKIGWNIVHYFPALVDWLRGWLKVYDRGRFNILLTTYDELITDEHRLFGRILDFHGIARQRFQFTPLPKDRGVHFRKGDPDEWRSVYTPPQIEACNALLPDQLLERFGWVR